MRTWTYFIPVALKMLEEFGEKKYGMEGISETRYRIMAASVFRFFGRQAENEFVNEMITIPFFTLNVRDVGLYCKRLYSMGNKIYTPLLHGWGPPLCYSLHTWRLTVPTFLPIREKGVCPTERQAGQDPEEMKTGYHAAAEMSDKTKAEGFRSQIKNLFGQS